MKKWGAVSIVAIFIALLPTTVVHAESRDSLSRIFTDSLYGGAAGALVGAATLAFVDKPDDHKDNILKGAGIGVILGAIYGTMKVSHTFAEVKDGKMTVQFPAIQPIPDASAGKGALLWNLNMLAVSF